MKYMRNYVKKLYNSIMYSSFFLAIMGMYCKITYKYINNDSVIFYFAIGIAITIIILLALHHLFRLFHLQYLK